MSQMTHLDNKQSKPVRKRIGFFISYRKGAEFYENVGKGGGVVMKKNNLQVQVETMKKPGTETVQRYQIYMDRLNADKRDKEQGAEE